jgi:hypothetical protein
MIPWLLGGLAYLSLAFFFWSLCAAAGNADRQMGVK